MAKCNLTVKIKVSWWLRYLYIPSLCVVTKICQLFNPDVEPDWEFTAKVINRGIKFEVE